MDNILMRLTVSGSAKGQQRKNIHYIVKGMSDIHALTLTLNFDFELWALSFGLRALSF